jgi:amino acid adenylation domain-containing protein
MRGFRDHNIVARILGRAASAPHRVALRLGAAEVTYGDLALRARRLAGWLLEEADPRDARVIVLAKRSIDAYVAVLGAGAAGMAYVPVDPDLPFERRAEMIRRARPAAIVADHEPDPRLAEVVSVPVVHPAAHLSWRAHPLEEPRPVPPEAPAYLMFTSGTTGVPKAVVVTAGNVAHFLQVMRGRCPLRAEDRVSQFYDLTFDLSIFEIFPALEAGACLHVVPAEQRLCPAGFIRDEALTVWSSVPSVIGFLRRLGQIPPGSLPSLRLAMFCGEPLPAAHVEAWRRAAPSCVIDNQYGPTEATVSCLGEMISGAPRLTPEREVVSIGKPYPGMLAGVVDATGRFLAPGEVGELALSGPQVSAGYFDDPELTRRRFPELSHPVLGRATWYLTGDLAREDAEGCFHHLGRIDHQVKILGKRVELEEIEAHLRAVTGGDAAAVPWPLQDGAAVGVVAFVAGGQWTPEDALAAIRGRLPAHMVPGQLVRKAALPLGSTGKIDRRALLQELSAPPGPENP